MKSSMLVGVLSIGLLTTAHGFRAIAESTAPMASTDEDAYVAGTKAMNEQRWPDAIRAFDRVIANKSSKHVDGALYWKAYSLSKLVKMSDASASCAQLQSQFPASSWNDECKTLLMGGSGTSTGSGSSGGSGSGGDEELKMLALNSLMNQDPSKAMPILRGMLTGKQPEEIKEHAIFVLTQSKSPEATEIVHDAITGKLGAAIQKVAIPQVGVFKGQRMNDTLVGVFHSTSDPEVKQAVVSALFISKDASRMVELARAEKNVEIKREIVSQLALLHDKATTDYMMELLK